MKPIKVGIWFDQKLLSGGGYQQSINSAILISNMTKEIVSPIYFTPYSENILPLEAQGLNVHLIRLPFLISILLKLQLLFSRLRNLRFLRIFSFSNLFENSLLKYEIDLVYFLSPSPLAIYLNKINYITTVWDLAHRDDPEFPEVRCNGIFEGREKIFKSTLPKAVAIIVDSSLGKDNLIKRYGIDYDRIHIIPFSPGQVVGFTKFKDYSFDVSSYYQLTTPYIFYPAQFWPHKNHVYIIEGIVALERIFGIKISAIFSGVDKGNMSFIQRKVDELNLSARIKFADFVTEERLYHLYKQSLALVMPTYFGPTNIPPLEAFSLEVPVLYSDKVGLKEQVRNAALLMDLHKPASMADALHKILVNPMLADQLKINGKKLLSEYDDENRLGVLEGIFLDFQIRLSCWK
jgi:glycosyltransferase involved in cell wall biosynthesis